jgi:hypothetical protein
MVRSGGCGAVVFMEPRYRADESIDCDHARYDSCGPPRDDCDVWGRGHAHGHCDSGNRDIDNWAGELLRRIGEVLHGYQYLGFGADHRGGHGSNEVPPGDG